MTASYHTPMPRATQIDESNPIIAHPGSVTIKRLVCIGVCVLLSGCMLAPPAATPTQPVPSPLPVATSTPTVQPSPSPIPPSPTPAARLPDGFQDVSETMRGICFEAAYDAAGQTFILRNELDLMRFFDGVDNSRLCRRAIQRESFDFTGGTVIAGLWSIGRGCKAQHDILAVRRDEAAQTLDVDLKLIIEGDCPYDLVRPLWLGIETAQDYAITLTIQERETIPLQE